mmetsp:Transcript_9522/g.16991  ORF Transcript_9522/g.16991 Transcript_9522/m.16991 type:complete len:390 (+) Transcript_9522:88-1257(+)
MNYIKLLCITCLSLNCKFLQRPSRTCCARVCPATAFFLDLQLRAYSTVQILSGWLKSSSNQTSQYVRRCSAAILAFAALIFDTFASIEGTAPLADLLDSLRANAAATTKHLAIDLVDPLGHVLHDLAGLFWLEAPMRHFKRSMVWVCSDHSLPATTTESHQTWQHQWQLRVMHTQANHVVPALTGNFFYDVLEQGSIVELGHLVLTTFLIENCEANDHRHSASIRCAHGFGAMLLPFPHHLNEDHISSAIAQHAGLFQVACVLYFWLWPLAIIHVGSVRHARRMAAHAPCHKVGNASLSSLLTDDLPGLISQAYRLLGGLHSQILETGSFHDVPVGCIRVGYHELRTTAVVARVDRLEHLWMRLPLDARPTFGVHCRIRAELFSFALHF